MKVGDRVTYFSNRFCRRGLVLRVGIQETSSIYPRVDIAFVHPERLACLGSATWRDAIDRVVEVPHIDDVWHEVHGYESEDGAERELKAECCKLVVERNNLIDRLESYRMAYSERTEIPESAGVPSAPEVATEEQAQDEEKV